MGTYIELDRAAPRNQPVSYDIELSFLQSAHVHGNICKAAAEISRVRPCGRVSSESWSEVGGDPEGLPELGHVVPVVVGRLVALVEVDLLFR
jgi:hypothetical protein